MPEFIPIQEAAALIYHKTTFVKLGLVKPELSPEEMREKLIDPDFALKFQSLVADRLTERRAS